MGYSTTNTKQKNTYLGETATQSPLLQLANQISQLSSQKQAQQNLLFGGEGYGGSFRSDDQRNWKKMVPDPNDPTKTVPNPSRYPNAKPFGGWGGYQGGSPGYGSDNPTMNPGAGGQWPTWNKKPTTPDSQQSQQMMSQKAVMPSLDDDGSQSKAIMAGVPIQQETVAEPGVTQSGSMKGVPNYQSIGGQQDFMESRYLGQKQQQGAGPSGGGADPSYPFSYASRAQNIKDVMAKKPGAYSEGAQEALLNRLANPFSAADPGIEEALRAQGGAPGDDYELARVTNMGWDKGTGTGGPRGESGTGIYGSERFTGDDYKDIKGMPGYTWIKKSANDPSKWRRNAGF